MCVPVRLSCSRRKCASSRRGSTCALRTLPLTVTETWTMSLSFRVSPIAYLVRADTTRGELVLGAWFLVPGPFLVLESLVRETRHQGPTKAQGPRPKATDPPYGDMRTQVAP